MLPPVRAKYVGLFVGLFAGWLIVQYGLFKAAFVGLAALVGWTIGRILEGELDISHHFRRPGDQDLE
ncbi:MAG TPA: DUF2273 domain-containing protein [Armatimonadota bacterium]|nr:DUF2273 domain-containing protein [Armatimonadota bacterium]